ncbi:MAG: adenine phosphoribosyltransferase [Myxococcales bacterium]|nr:adenine phosphoribosyltransferase [Myxococcales bacterium]MDD9971430.1 adenine phosphoribosyltransferase [Myxococcales bacterium]
MDEERIEQIKSLIRDVPDFPKPGILFKDISPILADPSGFNVCLDLLAEHYDGKPLDTIVGIESRGFIFGAALAARMRKSFVPVRKPGKLPAETFAIEYELEYGTDSVEIHVDALKPGDRVLVLDDLLATGGTAAATGQLVRKAGAELIGAAFVIELAFLSGSNRLDVPVFSLVKY